MLTRHIFCAALVTSASALGALAAAQTPAPERPGQARQYVDPRTGPTEKPPLHARHWLAITGKPLSASAGAQIFVKGGNAVDAAAAMLAAGCTMWDTLSCGGETQALIYNPHTGKVIGLNALDVEGRFRNGLQPNLRMTLPDGESTRLGLAQVGPGRYQARAPLRVSGEHPYRFELLADEHINAQDVRKVGSRALYYPYADEYRAALPNLSLLQTLASQTGGKFNAPVADIFAEYGDRTEQPVKLWPALLVAALLFYLLDILVRRAAWIWQRMGNAPLRAQASQTAQGEAKQSQA